MKYDCPINDHDMKANHWFDQLWIESMFADTIVLQIYDLILLSY